jgi:hypothetical protein
VGSRKGVQSELRREVKLARYAITATSEAMAMAVVDRAMLANMTLRDY